MLSINSFVGFFIMNMMLMILSGTFSQCILALVVITHSIKQRLHEELIPKGIMVKYNCEWEFQVVVQETKNCSKNAQKEAQALFRFLTKTDLITTQSFWNPPTSTHLYWLHRFLPKFLYYYLNFGFFYSNNFFHSQLPLIIPSFEFFLPQ